MAVDELLDFELVGVAQRAGREPARLEHHAPAAGTAPPGDPTGSFFVSVNNTTVLNTDLLTPLGAYLHLRGAGRGAFLLESVEQGRLGRYSLVGSGDRLVTFAEAEALDEPVVGYLGYDHVAQLEPTVQLPDDGRGLPESRFVVADMLVRFDQHDRSPRCWRAIRRGRRPPRGGGAIAAGRGGRARGSTTAVRRARPTTNEASSAARSTSARATRSRSSCRSGRNGAPTLPRSRSTARCAGSIRRRTSSCWSWTVFPSSDRPRRRSSGSTGRGRR